MMHHLQKNILVKHGLSVCSSTQCCLSLSPEHLDRQDQEIPLMLWADDSCQRVGATDTEKGLDFQHQCKETLTKNAKIAGTRFLETTEKET